ncbi:hypothetical protein [uncultured Arcticibacterium sp.]|uniref:hypothetical protein n=1 Tax=uncultured Arcticibacterium sp. TaxID=2173042 RepID=UPI0030F72D95
MRLSKLILFLFLTSSSVFAYCGDSGIWVFPNDRKLNKNPVFIVEGFARSQKAILSLNKEHKIYLKSGNSKVDLVVLETLIGDFQLTQAVLKPEVELIPGLVYSLEIDNLKNPEILRRFNFETKKFESIEFIVGEELDLKKPRIKRKPQVSEEVLTYWGCGKEVKVIFDFKVKDDSEVVVRALVRNRMTGKETEFYVSLINDKMVLGKNMCSGAFLFEEEVRYEAEFVVMDASGNKTAYSRKPINLSRPAKRTYPEFSKLDLKFESIELDDL